MRWILLIAAPILVISLGASKGIVQAVTFPTLYDNFATKRIVPDRWEPGLAWLGFGIFSVQGYETEVQQHGGRLKVELRAYGSIGVPGPLPDDSGDLRFSMPNARAASATGIQVTARVNDFNTTGCGSSDPSRSLVRLRGNFFRDGSTPSNPDDVTGLVWAANQIVVRSDLPEDTLRVNFFASKCLDPNCNTAVDLGFGGFQDVKPGQDVTLGIELDAPNNRIIFTKDAETQFLPHISALQLNTDIRALPHRKGIDVRHRLETCPTRAQGFVEASFANFRIKP